MRAAFQSTPLIRGETGLSRCCPLGVVISIHSPHARGDCRWTDTGRTSLISIHSPHTRGDRTDFSQARGGADFNPLPSHEGRRPATAWQPCANTISIHSPHTRGDSISLQKSIRIYVSLHNKTMIHRFSELYKPLFAAQSPIFGVRSPRESHDSFTFARPSAGPGITP